MDWMGLISARKVTLRGLPGTMDDVPGPTRRGFHVAAIYWIWGIITAALGVRPNRSTVEMSSRASTGFAM